MPAGVDRTAGARRAAALLADHPRVLHAQVDVEAGDAGRGRLVARLTPRPVSTGGAERVAHLQSMYELLYSKTDAPADPAFDVLGWVSSYDGAQMDPAALHEWVDLTVASVLASRPARVIELGCGTGLLMSRIAPHCERYWATDFSVAALRRARRAVPEVAVARRVRLLQRHADDLTGLPGDVDGVVINSVVQYFPDLDYLRRVLSGAVHAVRPGGTVWVGDVRSLPLHEVFHASVVAATSPDAEPAARAAAVFRRLAFDQELVIDPAFFTGLVEELPGVAGVEVRPKPAVHRNELSMFRYDVLLHVGERAAVVDVPWEDADAYATPGALRDRLATDRPDILAVTGIPDALVAPAVSDWEAIRRGTPTRPWCTGPAPEDATAHRLTRLADGLPYRLRLGLTAGRTDGALDAVWVRQPGPVLWSIAVPTGPARGPLSNRMPPGPPSSDELAAYLRPWLAPDLIPNAFIWQVAPG
ncbi:class I SAM-dependent methyltransferase [Micromonospora inaquosa]|uniref:class I SAM-dependent methyltransferase n=1 Tax=Micromonospora inaquosa TaxID=2203716 RepID=UPI0033D68CDB